MTAPPGDDLGVSKPRSWGLDPRIGHAELAHRIDKVTEPPKRYTLVYLYETASRANEACGLQRPADKNTAAMGPRRKDVTFDSLDGHELLRISVSTLKRKGRPVRTVALPLGGVDPWVDYLAKQFGKLDPEDWLVPYTRAWAYQILRENDLLVKAQTEAMKNPLRHIRIGHLIRDYGFTPPEITAFAGWELGATMMGFGGSPTASQYFNARWQDYFPKLLKQIPS